MALDYLASLAANLVTVTGNVFSSSSENTIYPHENIAVGWPAKPFKFNAAAADDQITVDFTSAKAVTFCSVHGHNIDSGISAIQLRKSSDNFSASDVLVATMTKAIPTFFTSFASTSFRYWRLKFVGTNTAAPIELGEWALGVKSTLTNPQLVNWTISELRPQIRQTGKLISQALVTNLTNYQQRIVTLDFIATSYAERNEIRDEFFVNTKWGEEPLIIVPDPDDEIVIHGRVSGNLTWSRRASSATGGMHQTKITITEDPFSIQLP